MHRIWCFSDGKNHITCTIDKDSQDQILSKLNLNIKSNVDPLSTKISQLESKLDNELYKLGHILNCNLNLSGKVWKQNVRTYYQGKYQRKHMKHETPSLKCDDDDLEDDSQNGNLPNYEIKPKKNKNRPGTTTNDTVENNKYDNDNRNDQDKSNNLQNKDKKSLQNKEAQSIKVNVNDK